MSWRRGCPTAPAKRSDSTRPARRAPGGASIEKSRAACQEASRLTLTEKQLSRLLNKFARKNRVEYGIDAKCDACADLKDERAIYFPYQLDYRGRAYCIPTGVSPQADDIGRTLLEFADGKRVGFRGLFWLAVNLANSWGRDKTDPTAPELGKQSFRKRLAWVRTHSKKILQCAGNPGENQWWMKAGKPWRFLAACFDWQGYRNEGIDFVSHLPITVDGTCNGLQHLAALGKNNLVARETNLEPSAEPYDIYQKVAGALISMLEVDRSAGNAFAIEWQKVDINRDLCKAAVMTTPYGVTERGMVVQLFESDLTEPLHLPGYGGITTKDIRKPGVLALKLARAAGYTPRFLVDEPQRINSKENENGAAAGRKAETIAQEESGPDPQGIIGKFIWERLSPGTRQMILEPVKSDTVECVLLANDLNAILEEESLYNLFRTFTLELSEETKTLAKTATLEKDGRRRLNRLLLSEVYSREIKWSERRRWECCVYLAEKLAHTIQELIDPNEEMKKWFENTAKPFPRPTQGISWASPSGFPVCQRAVKVKGTRVRAGKFSLVVYVQRKPLKIDFAAQKRKIVPNFIHSLDAAHMMLTVRRLYKNGHGLRHFGVIHDGYAVHACDVQELQKALREEFIAMHKKPVLEELRKHQNMARTDEQDPPVMGDFDIERVRNSKYFFC